MSGHRRRRSASPSSAPLGLDPGRGAAERGRVGRHGAGEACPVASWGGTTGAGRRLGGDVAGARLVPLLGGLEPSLAPSAARLRRGRPPRPASGRDMGGPAVAAGSAEAACAASRRGQAPSRDAGLRDRVERGRSRPGGERPPPTTRIRARRGDRPRRLTSARCSDPRSASTTWSAKLRRSRPRSSSASSVAIPATGSPVARARP